MSQLLTRIVRDYRLNGLVGVVPTYDSVLPVLESRRNRALLLRKEAEDAGRNHEAALYDGQADQYDQDLAALQSERWRASLAVA